jgi:PRTRC genetic system ThiF family protein
MRKKKIRVEGPFHYTERYLLNPQHPVTVNVIGAGGNGSQMITQLARINKALQGLGHTGLHVTLFDNDKVTSANMGRQLFSPAEIGQNKAVALITRINRFFGYSWKGLPVKFDTKLDMVTKGANITITCVDSIEARASIEKILYAIPTKQADPYTKSYYWMDLGNTQSAGQFVLGTLREVKQPGYKASVNLASGGQEDQIGKLKTLFEMFPDIRKGKTKDTGPSCSLAEALQKQDLFINSTLTQLAAGLLWKLFREGKIKYHGAFVNLETLNVAPIYIK